MIKNHVDLGPLTCHEKNPLKQAFTYSHCNHGRADRQMTYNNVYDRESWERENTIKTLGKKEQKNISALVDLL